MDPSPVTALVVTVALMGIFLGAVFAIGALYPSPPAVSQTSINLRDQTCALSTNLTVNGTLYSSCNATLYWIEIPSPQTFFSIQHLATVSFQGVSFNITGYNTMECPVVNVSGKEAAGATYTFLIYPTPLNCQFTQATAFSPDLDFGATWTGGSSIQVLVRAPLELREQTCPPTTNLTTHGAIYSSCNATLYLHEPLGSPGYFAAQRLATVSFQGVLFNITGYNTMECTVVNVTGREPTGATYSFLMWNYYYAGNCKFTPMTAFSADGDFGATWAGGSSIQVLVRVP